MNHVTRLFLSVFFSWFITFPIFQCSCLHAARTLTHSRWEDYEYEYLDDPKNQLAWLGDGQTYNEKVGKGDLAWYLDENELDYLP
ncbi:hypothetical protein B0F90DRAFT_1766355, partial [Multifurca ochricompacta]